ncbi:MAG: DUF3479 domain-containing protein, partial [Erythrobacter sp.]|nr:DUF3479 domain-containing protein [Erythrobacter sp.]
MHGKATPPPRQPKSAFGHDAPVSVAIVTLDNHLKGAVERADALLSQENIRLSLHAASEWGFEDAALAETEAAIAEADIVIATMLFVDDHVRRIMPALKARQEECDAMVCLMSAGEIVKLTRMGNYRMDAPAKGPLALLKKLRGSPKKGASSSGAGQMKMLRRLPKILKYIPGTAQDVRAYFLTLQYWLAGSDENVVAMVRALIDRYAAGERAGRKGRVKVPPPREYPETGVYHPRNPQKMSESLRILPRDTGKNAPGRTGTVATRDLDPYRVWYRSGGLYVVGLDHKSGEIRTFAIERIQRLDLTERRFDVEAGFDFDAYVGSSFGVIAEPATRVRIRFDKR